MDTPLQRPPHEQPEEKSFMYGKTPDQVITGHKYDGIKEYDNPMPGWWVWVFWATIVFSAIYFVGITYAGFIPTYEDDLAASQAELTAMREAHAASNPGFTPDEPSLRQFVDDPAAVEAGAGLYATVCAACHGDKGQGLIGPNLADEYWLHGGSNVDIFNVITEGVGDKGMPGWEAAYTAEQRAQMVAFIRSIQGTNPPGAKPPQGEKL